MGTDFENVDAGAPAAYIDEARERAMAAGFPDDYGYGYGGGFGTMQRYRDWPAIKQVLKARLDPATLRGVLGENFIAFKEHVTSN